ncbi:hypothetical protein [Streptomyces sp. NPDC093568]|uniref:hypothetical protein n=1 Tax=Streptomyces sp. NPDC093568 TaxID=3366041 RepID=UPI00382867A5
MKIISSTLTRAVGPALAAGLVVTALATPAAAQTPGSTALRIFGNVILSARANAVNNVTASVVGSNIRLTDSSGVAAGPGCSQVNPTTVDCPLPATQLAIGLGDLGDSFSGQGLSVRTVVDAGTGVDTVRTGAGNDTIGVNDGLPGDRVNCDGGVSDVVFRDPGDIIDPNCERRF